MDCKHLNQNILKINNRNYKKCLDCNTFLKRHKVSTPTHVKIDTGQIAEIISTSSDTYGLLTSGGHYFFYPKSKSIPIQFKNHLITG